MSRGSNIVVHRGGFLSALAYGFFGFLTATVVCSLAVGLYAINVADRKADSILDIGTDVLTSLPEILPEIRKALPAAVADAFDDRRDPQYREHVDLDVRLVSGDGRRSSSQLVIEAANNGPELITLMALRIVLVDEEDVPVRALSTYAATPATIDHEWRGPLMPGSTRRCSMTVFGCDRNLTPKAEITDLRVWSPEESPAPDSDTY